MSIKEFIKSRKNILMSLILSFIILNIYLLTINSFHGEIGDLMYMDILLMFVNVGIFIYDYIKWFGEKKKLCDLITKEELNYKLTLEEILIDNKRNIEKDCEKRINNADEKLKDMEEYISKWVHEAKLPISALNLMINNVQDIELSNNMKNSLEKINFHINSMLYGVRTSCAQEDIFIREENLEEIIKKAIKNNAFILIRNKIEVANENLDQTIYTDIKWITYVLEQIISNAIKYSKEKGKIEFIANKKMNYVELKIKDYGIGISEEDISRVFNKGFTGNNGRSKVYKSTGMGMYFSKNIINKLGHDIEVESIKNEYTEFKIRFYNISDYFNVTKM